jgi:hypothetical protein
MSRPLLMAAGAAAALVACHTTETVNPAPSGTSSAVSSSSSSSSSSSGAGGAGAVQRTVIQRNPFGNMASPKNLLWDGDFEWASAFSDQYGWLSGTSFSLGYSLPKLVVGARCQSGIRCALLTPNRIAVAMGVASKGKPLNASVWVKPEQGACSDVTVLLLPASDSDKAVALDSSNEDGWCHFQGLVPEQQAQIYLYVANESEGDILVDNAVVEAQVAGQGVRGPQGMPLARTVQEDYRWVAKEVRRVTKPSRPPPNKAREAFRMRRGVQNR